MKKSDGKKTNSDNFFRIGYIFFLIMVECIFLLKNLIKN